jgi:hypothetical protein
MLSYHQQVTGKHEHNKNQKSEVACNAKQWQQKYEKQRNCAPNNHPIGMVVHCFNFFIQLLIDLF